MKRRFTRCRTEIQGEAAGTLECRVHHGRLPRRLCRCPGVLPAVSSRESQGVMKAGTPGEAICDELPPMARDIGRGTVHVRWRQQRDTLPWCRSMTAASCPTASEYRVA